MTRSPVERWLGIEEDSEEDAALECDHGEIKKEERTHRANVFNNVGIRVAYEYELSICKLCGDTVGYAYRTLQDLTQL